MKGVYLIQEDGSKKFKIGFTETIEARVLQLQTGNSENLILLHYFQTKTKKRLLETALKNHFKSKRKKGEWFLFENQEEKEFLPLCEKYEKMLLYMEKNNAFF